MSPISKFTDLIEKKEYVNAAAAVLYDSSAVFAATVGLDGRPQVRPALFAFEQDGAFYFITRKSSRMYAELSKTPYVQFCVRNEKDELTFRLSGKVCFTDENTIIDRAAKTRPEIIKSSGEDKKALIAFFLLGAEALLKRCECLTAHCLYLPKLRRRSGREWISDRSSVPLFLKLTTSVKNIRHVPRRSSAMP